MRYIVTEIKIYHENDAITVTPFTYTERPDAERKFHQLVADAVVSERKTHTVTLSTSDGQLIERKVYHHAQPEPEAEEPTEEEGI